MTTGGGANRGLTWIPRDANEFPALEEPCYVRIVWMWENGIYS